MKSIGYIRCSTREQADSGLGLEAQRERIRAYAKMRGLDLIDMLEDPGASGSLPLAQRFGGAQLVERLEKRKPDAGAVVMLKLDRGFRNAGDCLATCERWSDRGIQLHIVDLGGNAVDTSSAMGKFMLTVLAGAAEMERNLTRERTSAALRVKITRGQRVGGSATYGYRLQNGRQVEDAREQQVIGIILDLHSRSFSPSVIERKLRDQGVTGRGGRPLQRNRITQIIRREAQRAAAAS